MSFMVSPELKVEGNKLVPCDLRQWISEKYYPSVKVEFETAKDNVLCYAKTKINTPK